MTIIDWTVDVIRSQNYHNLCFQIVKGIQLAKRTGVIKARVIGAHIASEPILGMVYFWTILVSEL